MSRLREAAQAFLRALAIERAVMLNDSTREAHAALTATLSTPSPDRWTEGRDAAAKRIDEAARDMDDRGLRSLVHGIAEDVRAMVPPATTAPATKPDPREVCERLLGAVGIVGALEKKTNAEIGKLLLDHVWASEEALGTARELLISEAVSRLAPGLDPEAPEAKDAESEVGWIRVVGWDRRPYLPVFVYDDRADASQADRYHIRAVTVTPAPVEPEETP